ncbi:SDR family oxidoreductase [Afipia sp. TerB]
MIVMFGASSDIGRRATTQLLNAGRAMRLVSRNPDKLDPRAEHVTGDAADARAATEGASVVISCAHARHTQQILHGLSLSQPILVLVGSAWRYSKVYEPAGREVVRAEEVFTASGRNGVMLHPTMIYGGTQENNLRRLFAAIQRWPVLPMPGGGSNLVQPVFVEDVARCIVAAATRAWQGPHAIPVCGPAPMRWRDMAEACMSATGQRRSLLSIPLTPAITMLELARSIGLRVPLDPNVLRRFQEDVSFSPQRMQDELGVAPRDFAAGLSQMLAEDGLTDRSRAPR